MSALRKVWTIAGKDLSLEKRSREMLSSMFVFALIVILVFSFSFELRVERVEQVAPGVLWVAISFSGMLGLARSFVQERDQGCLDGLLLCPIDRGVIYVGKVLSNLCFATLAEVVLLPLSLILFGLPFRPLLVPVLLLGTLGFSAVGTLVSAMTVHVRAREMMLPVLLFPLVMPAIIAAVRLTAGILDARPWGEISHWLQLLVAFDLVFLFVSYIAFGYAVEE